MGDKVSKLRIGQSTDIHQFKQGNHITLGGVKIDFDKEVEAHSDGDILVHSITEAIIGALGLDDLGSHFSDTDSANEGMNSLDMLKKIDKLMKDNDYQIVNIDTLIITEEPNIGQYRNQMKKNIASVLGIEMNQINVKGTRAEKLGPIGEGKGIIAQAIVLIEKSV